MASKPGERRLQILQTLAAMLETPRGEKVTTAALASRLDVSEAALSPLPPAQVRGYRL
jgi:TetR/AcrR family transcriptional regulator